MTRSDFLTCETWETTLLLGRVAEAASRDAAALGVPTESLIFNGDDEAEGNPWLRHRLSSFER
ncbi:MAG: hypothetical protein P1V51_12235 [Deltaproteobacteria bacterium]|nr:hypothetical protein [Deltaproteobacteria bacterium]